MKKVAIIQARMGSTRMPGKTLAPLRGKPLLGHLLESLRLSRQLTDIVVATTDKKEDDAIETFARESGVACFRGSEENVLERFCEAAKSIGAADNDIVARITGDDIFVDAYLLDSLFVLFESAYPHCRFLSNSLQPGFPYGMYFELFDVASLANVRENATTPGQKEHVTPYLREHPEKFPAIAVGMQGIDFSNVRLSIDTPADFKRADAVLEQLEQSGKKQPFRLNEIVDAYTSVTGEKV